MIITKTFWNLKKEIDMVAIHKMFICIGTSITLHNIKLSGFYQEADHNISHKFLSNFNHSKIKGSFTGLKHNAMEVFISLL